MREEQNWAGRTGPSRSTRVVRRHQRTGAEVYADDLASKGLCGGHGPGLADERVSKECELTCGHVSGGALWSASAVECVGLFFLAICQTHLTLTLTGSYSDELTDEKGLLNLTERERLLHKRKLSKAHKHHIISDLNSAFLSVNMSQILSKLLFEVLGYCTTVLLYFKSLN